MSFVISLLNGEKVHLIRMSGWRLEPLLNVLTASLLLCRTVSDLWKQHAAVEVQLQQMCVYVRAC